MSNQQSTHPSGATEPLDTLEQCCSTALTARPLAPDRAGELARVFKALSDPVRLRLLTLIAAHENGEACVCDLTGAFELTGPTISHHLKALRIAGLIDCERRGTWVYYWVVPGVLERIGRVFEAGPLVGSDA